MAEAASMELIARTKLVQALRDFFLATNKEEIHASLKTLAFYEKNPSISDDSSRLLEVEYMFNRLFIGPDKVLAPPFASIYLDNEPLLKGKTTEKIERLLFDLGLDFENSSNLPLDHISIELEIWLILSNVLENLQHKAASMDKDLSDYADKVELIKELESKLAWLSFEHMAVWIEQFLKRIENAPSELEALGEKFNDNNKLLEEILYVSLVLKAWLNEFANKK